MSGATCSRPDVEIHRRNRAMAPNAVVCGGTTLQRGWGRFREIVYLNVRFLAEIGLTGARRGDGELGWTCGALVESVSWWLGLSG